MAANRQINENDLDNEDFVSHSVISNPSKAAHWTYNDTSPKAKHAYHDFKEEVERSLKRVGYNQTKLADVMGCHYTVLNRKLSGVRSLKITHLKQIIKFMVESGALTDIASIEALLKLRNLNLTIFSSDDWNSTPLCKLANAAVFADSATGSVNPKAGKGANRPQSLPAVMPASAQVMPVIKPLIPLHNLPLFTKPTFVGRKRELIYLSSMIGDHSDVTHLQAQARHDSLDTNPVRLLTLTGPGGIGKTTLAQQLGAELLTRFEHGIYFVDLADIRQPEQLPGTIARTIGLNEVKGLAIEHTLKNHLKARNMLLILDNFEQILEAGLFVNELIEAAPGVRVIVTSRELLHLRNEQEYIVPLMSVPNLTSRKQAFMPSEPTDPTASELKDYEAVALFTQRARDARPSFTLTDQNAKAVAEICVKLEGLPLAIELAASRVRTLSPQQILELLTQIVNLQGSQRGRPSRHQTLRAVIDWSYALLNAKEQDLLRTLSVFASGFTFNAVVAVYGEKLGTSTLKKKQATTLTLLTSLIDKSLLRTVEVTSSAEPAPESSETRYAMLESIREYALELLEENQEEATQIRNWHANYYLKLAEEAEPHLRGGGQQVEWLNQLHGSHENFRRALQWLIDSEKAELANKFVGDLSEYWLMRSDYTEGREWSELALNLAERVAIDKAVLAKALRRAGRLQRPYNLKYAQELYERAKILYQELDDIAGLLSTNINLGGVYYSSNNYTKAYDLYLDTAELARKTANFRCVALALSNLGNIAVVTNQYEKARNFYTESILVNKTLGNDVGLAKGYLQLARLEMQFENLALAKNLCGQSLELYQKFEDNRGICSVLFPLGVISIRLNDYTNAKTQFNQALALTPTFEQPTLIEGWLDQFALVAISDESYLSAAQAWALMDVLHKANTVSNVMGDKNDLLLHNRIQQITEAHLDEATLATVYLKAKQSAAQRDKPDYMHNLLALSSAIVTAI